MNSLDLQLSMPALTTDISRKSGNIARQPDTSEQNQLREVAEDFEALFLQQMMKSMRSASDAIADENSPFNSRQERFYRDWFDGLLAKDLSGKQGLGLADMLVSKLSDKV
ncbi:rod-binding protein [Endozoicomonadaceae bacterium StTr2]